MSRSLPYDRTGDAEGQAIAILQDLVAALETSTEPLDPAISRVVLRARRLLEKLAGQSELPFGA